MELAKWGVLILIGIIVTAGTAVVSMRGPHWKRVMMFIMVWSMFAFPTMTLDFHFNARHNVRGWEFCWPDFIGLGLLIGHFASGKGVRGLFGITSIALAIHSFVLLVSAFVGVDTLFSMFYLNRFFRMAFMFVVIAVVVQDNKDRMALMLGFVGFLLFNMAAVLEQKYVFGRFQSTGLFDHQNAMAMCVTLVTPALFALILLQGYEKRLFVFLLIACGAGAYGVIGSLSRAGMLIFGAACGLALFLSFTNGLNAHKLKITGLITCLGLIGLSVLLPTILLRFNSGKANDASHRTREVMNEAAAGMYRDNFWFGVGPNNYAKVVKYDPYADLIDQSIREKGHKVDLSYQRGIVESHYWQMKSETGFFGYWSFVALLAASLGAAFIRAVANRNPIQRAVAIGIFAGLVGNYLQSTIEHTLVNYSNAYVWMALLGLVQGMPVFGKKPQQLQENESKAPEIVEEKIEMDTPEQQPDKAGDWSYVTGTPVAISSSGEADNENSHRTSNYW